jgi:hypothetical protein
VSSFARGARESERGAAGWFDETVVAITGDHNSAGAPTALRCVLHIARDLEQLQQHRAAVRMLRCTGEK